MIDRELFAGVVPFVAVAESRSFRKGAATLGVSTAAVSKSVARLESELGAKLFVRTSRSVELTPEGEAFLVRCREAIGSLTTARTELRDTRRDPRGLVTVSMSFVLASRVISGLSLLTARHPHLQLRLALSDRVVRVGEEGVDVGVRLDVPRLDARPDASAPKASTQPSGVVLRKLAATRWVTLASPLYLARRGLPAEPRELATHDVVRFVGPEGRARQLLFASGPVDPPARVLVDQGEHLLTAARAGLGIVQVFDFMVEEDLARGALVEVLAPHAATGPDVLAVTTPERRRSPAVRVVLDYLATRFTTAARATRPIP